MTDLLIWALGIVVVLVAVDRVLLALEDRGWINYRRKGLSKGAAGYHTLELHSIFEPGAREVMDVKYSEEKEEDDSGAPPGGE